MRHHVDAPTHSHIKESIPFKKPAKRIKGRKNLCRKVILGSEEYKGGSKRRRKVKDFVIVK